MPPTNLDERLADLCRALASPVRVQIIRLLAGHETYCGDLVKQLGISQSTVSHHLKALREAGFISGETEGPATCYSLNRACVRDLHILTGHLL